MPREIQHPHIDDIALASVFDALRDPVRLSIVQLADAEPGLPCGAFEERIPKSTMSHHWRILRQSGLIRQEPDGTTRRNYLRREEIDGRFPGLLDAVTGVDPNPRPRR